jgi:hypothetical protein
VGEHLELKVMPRSAPVLTGSCRCSFSELGLAGEEETASAREPTLSAIQNRYRMLFKQMSCYLYCKCPSRGCRSSSSWEGMWHRTLPSLTTHATRGTRKGNLTSWRTLALEFCIRGLCRRLSRSKIWTLPSI